MKLQLEKEHKEGPSGPWYRITTDGRYVYGSFDLEEIQKMYEKFKANPELLKNDTEILQSEEISVNL